MDHLPLAHVWVTVCLVTLSEWKGIVYSKFVTWPRAIYPSTHTLQIYAVADSTDLALEDLRKDAGEEDNGTVILSFTRSKVKRRKKWKLGRKG